MRTGLYGEGGSASGLRRPGRQSGAEAGRCCRAARLRAALDPIEPRAATGKAGSKPSGASQQAAA